MSLKPIYTNSTRRQQNIKWCHWKDPVDADCWQRLLLWFTCLWYASANIQIHYDAKSGAKSQQTDEFSTHLWSTTRKKYEYFLAAENCKWFYSYKYMHKSLAAVLNNTNEAVGAKENFRMSQIRCISISLYQESKYILVYRISIKW